jgi:hypothetical protein
MSFLSFDLLSPLPFGRFVSGDDFEDFERRETVSVASAEAADEAEDDRAVSPPLSLVHVDTALDDVSYDSSYGGITILSSVPSSRVGTASVTARGEGSSGEDNEMVVEPFQSSWQNFLSYEGDLALSSMSTSESVYRTVDRRSTAPLPTFSSLGSRSLLSSSLSHCPTSLASSIGDLSLSLQSVPFALDSSFHGSHSTMSPVQRLAGIRASTGSLVPAATQHWYARFHSEEEWDEFCNEVMQILSALPDEGMTPDQMLALLIQQEEALFWADPRERAARQRQQRLKSGLLLLTEFALILSGFSAAATAGAINFALRSRS